MQREESKRRGGTLFRVFTHEPTYKEACMFIPDDDIDGFMPIEHEIWDRLEKKITGESVKADHLAGRRE